MKRYIRILLVALLPLALFSCSEEQEYAGGNTGQLMLNYEVAGNVVTRADGSSSTELHETTENGWEEWNENTVKSLCLYVFDKQGNQVKVVSLEEKYKESGSYNLTKATNGSITPDNYQKYDLYLVANQPSTVSTDNISSLDDLKKLSVDNFSDYNKKQTSFVMDGKWTGEDDAVKSDESSKTKTITVKLNRALAKVCVSVTVYKDSYSDTNPTQLTSFTDLKATFHHYALNSALIEGGTTKAEEATLKDSDAESINQNVYTSDGKTSMVFYSYANDWFDTSKQEDMNKQEPVKTDRQSYITLSYKGHSFDVPVNFRLPQFSDKKWSQLTETEKQTVQSYYQLSRNHVYNVKVSLLETTDKLYYRYTVNDWTDGGEIEFGTKITTSMSHGSYKSSESSTAVMYESGLTSNSQPQCSPVITLKVNSNSRAVLQTNNTNFQFWTSEGLKDYIEIAGNGQDQTVAFALVPKYDIDLADPHNTDATVFLVLPDAYNYKVPFNTGEGKLPGNDAEICYKQLSKDSYESASSVTVNN